MKYDFVIIGAGIAGLETAFLLSELYPKAKITIWEKLYRIGGRIESITIPDTDLTYEAGAGRIGSRTKQPLIWNVVDRFNLKTNKLSDERQYIAVNKCNELNKNETVPKMLKKIYKSKHKNNNWITFQTAANEVFGEEKARALRMAFGYDSEFLNYNAKDAIIEFKNNIDPSLHFYSVKPSLNQILEEYKKLLEKRNIKIELGHCLKELNYNQKTKIFDLEAVNHKKIKSKNVFLAIPKASLIKMKIFKEEPIMSYIKSVHETALCRIYSIHKSRWFKNVKRTTTDDDLRQFIPINYEKGLSMVSYSDSEYANRWNALLLSKSESEVESNIYESLIKVFPKYKSKIEKKPDYLKVHYWPVGVHKWKPYADSQKVMSQIKKPFNLKQNNINLFIVGESYSKNQGWMEGSLETVHDTINKYFKQKELKRIFDLKPFKLKSISLYPTFTIINGRVYDLKDWIKKHPGGPVIKKALGKDATEMFETIGHPDYARQILNNYLIGYLN